MKRRVVVTGTGLINPLGHDVETVWTALQEGQSGVGPTTIFDASRFPTRIAAQIKEWDVSRAVTSGDQWMRRARHTQFAAAAAEQAVNQAGILDRALTPTRFGVYLGSGEGDSDFASFSQIMMHTLH